MTLSRRITRSGPVGGCNSSDRIVGRARCLRARRERTGPMGPSVPVERDAFAHVTERPRSRLRTLRSVPPRRAGRLYTPGDVGAVWPGPRYGVDAAALDEGTVGSHPTEVVIPQPQDITDQLRAADASADQVDRLPQGRDARCFVSAELLDHPADDCLPVDLAAR